MSVTIQRSGTNGVVTVTTPIGDLITAVQDKTMTKPAAETELVRRCAVELNEAATVMLYSDEEIDAKAAEATAKATEAKANRPTGGV